MSSCNRRRRGEYDRDCPTSTARTWECDYDVQGFFVDGTGPDLRFLRNLPNVRLTQLGVLRRGVLFILISLRREVPFFLWGYPMVYTLPTVTGRGTPGVVGELPFVPGVLCLMCVPPLSSLFVRMFQGEACVMTDRRSRTSFCVQVNENGLRRTRVYPAITLHVISALRGPVVFEDCLMWVCCVEGAVG